MRTDDAAVLTASLSAELGMPVDAVTDEGASAGISDLRAPGAGSGRLVTAVSELIRRGEVRLLVGTRGLLGEGWDCPAVNTLIDLTAVATSSATQQLRGRTLRLDPAWPRKVAHNWSVVCLIPPHVAVDDTSEPNRLRRRHSHLWGLDADGGGRIVSGLGHLLPRSALETFERALDKEAWASVAEVDAELRRSWPDRSVTRAQWRIGEAYESRERDEVTVRRRRSAPLLRAAQSARSDGAVAAVAGIFGSGILLTVLVGQGVLLPPALTVVLVIGGGALTAATAIGRSLVRALRDRSRPAEIYRRAAIVVARTLHDAGRIGPVEETTIRAHRDAIDPTRIRIEIGGGPEERRIVTDAVEELFSAVRTPRFLLRVDRGGAPRARLLARVADRLSPGRTLLPVPRLIARRRGDAERFRDHWQHVVGACTLHELQGVEGLALLRVARSSVNPLDTAVPRARIWG